MENLSIILKPTYWRLLIWRVFPMLIIIGITVLISAATPARSLAKTFLTYFLSPLFGILTAQILLSLLEWFNKSLVIEIAEGKIIGSRTSPFSRRQKIPLRDLAKTSLLKKSSYQKSFGVHKLCSTRGEIITFTPFVYEKSLVDEFYKTLSVIQAENLKGK
ncbi:MAG: hypothetical protein HYZ21_00235 [Chloroflexi bacterium]|nr:hypothetical protein [Chloroflexota bacterium]